MTTKASTQSRDAEAIRWQKSQTRTLLFADCRNPFEDVTIATRLRQVLHTHQGRDKMFKCIMYFLRIYMWMKNIKLNFMFIEGASEENFTLVERNYMTIMNSRRLFRLGRFVGEWVRIQVTLLKSAQLIYAPSNNRWVSYFVQLQMVLDVCARLLLFAKCICDDLAYVSQKGFLHSAVAGKLLYVGARLAVPVMTSDLFLNSLNLAQRILDSRHVVTVKESPEFQAFYGQQRMASQWQQLAVQQASSSTHPVTSFETLPLASFDDVGELKSVGSRRQLLLGLNEVAGGAVRSGTTSQGTYNGLLLRPATNAGAGLMSNDSIHMPPSEAATPKLKDLNNSQPQSLNDSGIPPMAIGRSTVDIKANDSTGSIGDATKRRPQETSNKAASAMSVISSSKNEKQNVSTTFPAHQRTASGKGIPTPVVLSAAMEAGTRVGRSFSLLHTFNDIDKKRKGIQKQQEEQKMALQNISSTMGLPEGSGHEDHHQHHHHVGSPVSEREPPTDLPLPLSTGTPCASPTRGMAPIDSPTTAGGPDNSISHRSHGTNHSQLFPMHHTPTTSTPTVRGNLANYVHALYRPQLDPNNSDERDAVMKAAEEGDLLDILSKNDAEDHHPSASLRHLSGQHAGGNRTYDQHDLHHGGMLRVKSETWTEEQILEGNISAPREHRLKAIANTISAQQRLAAEARAEQQRLSKEVRFDRQNMLSYGAVMTTTPSSTFAPPPIDDNVDIINALEAAEGRLSANSNLSPSTLIVSPSSPQSVGGKSSPSSALLPRKPNFSDNISSAIASPAAQLKMAIDRSIQAYTSEVAARDQLTPVNNYIQLLWRDYELHWACVTQLKLILDYYVLMSVVFNWEGVRGKTAIMGLISGLLSVYRVFVYGR